MLKFGRVMYQQYGVPVIFPLKYKFFVILYLPTEHTGYLYPNFEAYSHLTWGSTSWWISLYTWTMKHSLNVELSLFITHIYDYFFFCILYSNKQTYSLFLVMMILCLLTHFPMNAMGPASVNVMKCMFTFRLGGSLHLLLLSISSAYSIHDKKGLHLECHLICNDFGLKLWFAVFEFRSSLFIVVIMTWDYEQLWWLDGLATYIQLIMVKTIVLPDLS